MTLLKDRLTRQVEASLEAHVQAAEGWAGKVRLLFALMFAAAAAWVWNHPSDAKFIYLALAGAWALLGLFSLTAKQAAAANVTALTLADITIAHLGLITFVQQGLFPRLGAGIYLCYFPILAVAANRYRITLVLLASAYAALGYTAISLAAGSPPWLRLAILVGVAYVFVQGSRKPQDLMVTIALEAAREAQELGSRLKEQELMPQVHQLFLPPPIVELPQLWSSSKHGVGTETNGDYYQVFDTARGPLIVVGDLGGSGLAAVNDVAQLHAQLAKIVSRESSLPNIAAELNTYVFEKFRGRRPFTCVLAEWEGEQLRYVNAGHLPLLHLNKPQGAQIAGNKQLPVTCDAIGLQANATFTESVVPFPVRDQLVIYTDGVFAKLSSDRAQGVAKIEEMASQFSGGEVTTLCHRIFDCGQPGLDANKDDATVVVIRRQPAAAAAAAESKA